MSGLCSRIAGFFNDERAKADAAVKKCGKKACTADKKKQAQIKAAQKKAKDSCAKGIAPDLTRLGLDKYTQKRLNNAANFYNGLYDGKGKLPGADFNAGPSKPVAALTGGGKVADLKASEPAINTTPIPEFSLKSAFLP